MRRCSLTFNAMSPVVSFSGAADRGLVPGSLLLVFAGRHRLHHGGPPPPALASLVTLPAVPLYHSSPPLAGVLQPCRYLARIYRHISSH